MLEKPLLQKIEKYLPGLVKAGATALFDYVEFNMSLSCIYTSLFVCIRWF